MTTTKLKYNAMAMGAILLIINSFLPNYGYSQRTRETGAYGIRLKQLEDINR